MRAMILDEPRSLLKLRDIAKPIPAADQILIRVLACGVCRTDLHIVDGELSHPCLPLILGHQIVGWVVELGPSVSQFKIGDLVGVPWLGKTCGHCRYCATGRENLCDQACFTGYQLNGGFADYCVAFANFCFPIPYGYSPLHAAPLLCAGLIGYRALRMIGQAKTVGFYGFGSAAHLLTQAGLYQGKQIVAFTRPHDEKTQQFAKALGAIWAGGSDQLPPLPLDAAIIFAPDGSLVPLALKAVDKGGVVVCAGIHMSDIPSFPYELLYQERILRSVANLTQEDAIEFLTLAPQIPIQTTTTVYPLEKTNQALDDLRNGRLSGSAVIQLADN